MGDIREDYNCWSATYDTDANLTRDVACQAVREVLPQLPHSSILEIGCGTGRNTIFLAEIGSSVHAIDFSEGMIAMARERVQADNVTFAVADLNRPWPYPDRSADLIVDCLVLEHIESLSFIFSEASRCLTSGGHFFVAELHPFKQYQGAKANFLRNDEVVEIPAYAHHLSDFLDAAEQNRLALKGLHERWHVEDRGKPPRLVMFVFEKPNDA